MNPLLDLSRRIDALFHRIDATIPENLLADAESSRRARLIVRFGLLGLIFGCIYSALYFAIGHYCGAIIVLLSTIGVAVTPSLMRWRKSIEPAGHFFSLVLTIGFFSLCCCEGGVHGHALAWLVSVPLCAMLLLGLRASAIWLAIAFLTASIVIGADLAGYQLPRTYLPKWEPIVSAGGYAGLVVFMSALGIIFERGRAMSYSRLQKALEELHTSHERLVYLNQEKNEFMGIAAHDLKNPLTVIMASSDLIKLSDDTSSLHKMADEITTAAQRMHRLIMDLLDANAIEQGRYASTIESCEIRPLLEQMVKQNLISAQKKRISIRLLLNENLVVRTDADATQQILDNLISNAVKYSPAESIVHIRVVPENGHAFIKVRDEGPGLSDEDQKKLFQKYCRLSSKPTGGESSTGLGLSIAKRLAQSLGGDILCRSELGSGSTFTLRLPLGTIEPKVAPVAEKKDLRWEAAAYAWNRN